MLADYVRTLEHDDVVSKVKNAIVEHLPTGTPSAELVATPPAWLSNAGGGMGCDFADFYGLINFFSFFSFRICFDTLPETASRLLGECLRNRRAGHDDSLLAPSTTARV